MRDGGLMVAVLTSKLALEEKWDKKLRGKFALAPVDLQEQGISEEDYRVYTRECDLLWSEFVRSELKSMEQNLGVQKLAHGRVSVFGAGLGRGLRFVSYANQLSMGVDVYDVCGFALKKADRKLNKGNLDGLNLNSTNQVEITGQDDEFTRGETMLLVMAQFVQILSPERMRAVMQMVGRYLALPDRRVIIIHPSDEGNEGVTWGDTTPYRLEELLEPLQDGLKAIPKVLRKEKTHYFHFHYYDMVTISG